jgi:hypothetical protein
MGKTVIIEKRIINSSLEELERVHYRGKDQTIESISLILSDNSSITDVGVTQACDNQMNLTKLFLNNNQTADKGIVASTQRHQILEFPTSKLIGEGVTSINPPI